MITLIGAGGHARVVIDALIAGGVSAESLALRDGNAARQGSVMMGVSVACPELVPDLARQAVHFALGDCRVRLALLDRARDLACSLETIIHPRAVIAATATLAPGCFVGALAVIAPIASLSDSVIVNHGAVVDHDCTVGPCSHIAPNATLGGGVHVGAGVLVGSGATVLPGISIGDGAVIGAGAVVTTDVAPGEVRVGLPRGKSGMKFND